MGDRDAGQTGGRHGGAEAGDDLAGDAGLGQGERLLAAAPEDERVAALEPHHAAAAAGGADEQRVDRFLGGAAPPGALSDRDLHRPRRQLERRGVHEGVVEDQVRLGEAARRAQRQQVRVSRSRADQGDVTSPGLHASPPPPAVPVARWA